MQKEAKAAPVSIAIPTEGVWFDREDKPDGERTRTYWADGKTVAVIQKRRAVIVVERGSGPVKVDGWVVAVIWSRDGSRHAHEFPGLPLVDSEAADSIVDALGIGIESVRPAQHISKIGGGA